MKLLPNTILGFALFGAAALFVGCTPTHQARSVDGAGFLKDYTMLQEGQGGEALLVYRNPSADFSGYDKVMVEPFTVWRKAGGEDVDSEELQAMVDAFHASVRKRLGEDYQLVESSGPGVLRIRAAITEAEGSNPVMDIVSTVVPIGRAISAGQRIATGTASFVGAATAEIEVTDAGSGDLLIAAVDRRVGNKILRGSTDTWGDVEASFDYWAERIATRLSEERAK